MPVPNRGLICVVFLLLAVFCGVGVVFGSPDA